MRTARESYLSPAAALPSCAPSPSLANLKPINDDEKTGIDNVRRALVTPAKQIIDAGGDAAVVIGKLLEAKDYAYGFDAQIGEYADLVKKGIVDPTKVVRTALQDAASVVGLLITTEAMIAELPKRDAPAMPPGGGMDYRSRWRPLPGATRRRICPESACSRPVFSAPPPRSSRVRRTAPTTVT
jgi:chaperonin GroEL